MSYEPDLRTFCGILRDYSRHGLSYFRGQAKDMQQTFRASLSGNLEDDDGQIERKLVILSKGGQSQLHFLPMPRPSGRDFKASFFLPRISRSANGNYACSFVIVFWVEKDKGKTLGIRLEPAHEIGTSHAYTHAQLTRTTQAPEVTTDLADWTPESYPAIPLGYTHPIQLFVAMMIAVHGYSANESNEYAREVIIDSMAKGTDIQRARNILEEVKRMLG